MMKFQVAKSDLETALAVVSHAMASSGGDISSHYLFRLSAADPQKMEVLTYTGRLMGGALFKIGETLDGDPARFTIEGSRLKNWISVVPDGATLDFEYDKVDGQAADTTITVHGDDRKHITFATLDPATFPFWDKTMESVESKGKVNADRLRMALKRSGTFTAEEGSKDVGLQVVEVREGGEAGGVVTSTNKVRLCMTTIPSLKDARFRIHTKDIASTVGFLATCKTDELEVLETEKSFFLRRTSDQAYFGETKFHDTFKTVGHVPFHDHYTWVISRAGLTKALKAVEQGAPKEDDRLWMAIRDTDLDIRMETSTGKSATWNIPVKSTPGADVDSNGKPVTRPDLPPSIQINIANLRKLIDAIGDIANGDDFTLGVNYMPAKKSGYFRHETPSSAAHDHTLIMIVWNKNQ